MNNVRAGIRKTFLEVDYGGFLMAVVHMHDTVAGGYGGFGTK